MQNCKLRVQVKLNNYKSIRWNQAYVTQRSHRRQEGRAKNNGAEESLATNAFLGECFPCYSSCRN